MQAFFREAGLLLAVWLGLPRISLADLPVHCLRHQVVGDWEFTLGPLKPHRSSCGHSKPDTPDSQPPLSFLQSDGPTTAMKVSLRDPSLAVAEDGTRGSWTMIYDEAFEVAMGGMVYLAFSDFEFVQDPVKGRTNISHCDATKIGWYHDARRTRWGCYVGRKAGSTGPAGVSAPEAGALSPNSAAPVGERAALALAATSMSDRPEDDEAAADVPSATLATDEVRTLATDEASSSLDATLAQAADASGVERPSDVTAQALDATGDVTDSMANTLPASTAVPTVGLASLDDEQTSSLNADDADSGLAQADPAVESTTPASPELEVDASGIDAYLAMAAAPSSHASLVPSAGYDSPMNAKWQQSIADALNFFQLGWTATVYHRFQNKTARELNRLAGVRHARPVPKAGFRSSRAAAQRQANAGAFSSFLGVRSRVKRTSGHGSFDWHSARGQDWLQPVVSQGDCGSCYTISTVHMLTARNRIAKNDPSRAPFSVMFPLYCSEYNQGCDGGYGFLQSKWSEDVGLVPEICAPFSAETSACHRLDCDLGSTRFRATNHHYVGGFYGASEESSIREELVKSGPVVMSFEPKEDFMYYKNGVYRSGPHKIHQEWEQVDHAVLLTGFGEEKNLAYWRLQNSWGADWGEAGFFRMARGIDESGCESIVVAADVAEEDSNEVLDQFISQL